MHSKIDGNDYQYFLKVTLLESLKVEPHGKLRSVEDLAAHGSNKSFYAIYVQSNPGKGLSLN